MGVPARYSLVLMAIHSGVVFMAPADKAATAQEQHRTPDETTRASDRITPVEETQWPLVFPPLEVLVTPKHRETDNTADSQPEHRLDIGLSNGSTGNLLDFLNRFRRHTTDWHADEDFSAATRILRPDAESTDQDEYLTEKADLATIMGRNFLGLDLGQIYTHFGFEDDGTKARPSGYGVISPINPVSCLEGGISCRAPLTEKE